MKTEDIIKALALCTSDEDCITCPYRGMIDCVSEVMKGSLDLIESLYKELNETAKEQYINGRIDGVKEFVEKLKEYAVMPWDSLETKVVFVSDIDRIAKEIMKGDHEQI